MDDEHLTKNAAALFDEVEKWNAFLELTEMSDGIVEHWLISATRELRNHGGDDASGWEMTSWGNEFDTKWYLPEFGEDSVVIGFWDYEFTLSVEDQEAFDIEIARQQLNEPGFAALRGLFTEFTDPKISQIIGCRPNGMFRFGSPRDGNLPWAEFAWYTANRTEEFVEQAIQQVERITKNPEITALVAELNRAARIKA